MTDKPKTNETEKFIKYLIEQHPRLLKENYFIKIKTGKQLKGMGATALNMAEMLDKKRKKT